MAVYHPPKPPKKPAKITPPKALGGFGKAIKFPTAKIPSIGAAALTPAPKAAPAPPAVVAAAPVAAAPKAVVPQSFVPDAAFNTEVDDANAAETAALTRIDDQERTTKNEYGFDDVTNPNSRVAELKRIFLANAGSALVGGASRGQLYSGSTQNMQDFVRHGHEKNTSDLRAAYDRALGNLTEARSTTKNATEEAKRVAYDRWLARRPEVVAPAEDEPDAAPTAPAAPGPPQKGSGGVTLPTPSKTTPAMRAAAEAYAKKKAHDAALEAAKKKKKGK
jgi:hypothetical protein